MVRFLPNPPPVLDLSPHLLDSVFVFETRNHDFHPPLLIPHDLLVTVFVTVPLKQYHLNLNLEDKAVVALP